MRKSHSMRTSKMSTENTNEQDLVLGEGFEPLDTTEESPVELQLVEVAVNSVFQEFLFHDAGDLTVEHLQWRMKQLLAFPVTVLQPSQDLYQFEITVGDVIYTIDAQIEVSFGEIE
jgi:hypothetical protein